MQVVRQLAGELVGPAQRHGEDGGLPAVLIPHTGVKGPQLGRGGCAALPRKPLQHLPPQGVEGGHRHGELRFHQRTDPGTQEGRAAGAGELFLHRLGGERPRPRRLRHRAGGGDGVPHLVLDPHLHGLAGADHGVEHHAHALPLDRKRVV